MVFELRMTSANSRSVSGPMSSPCQPSGMFLFGAMAVLASLLKRSAIFESLDRTSFTPRALAFSMSERARSSLSSSQMELPILPPRAFMNVYVMPPQMMRLSTLPSKFSMISIFDDTFEPPMMAVKGRLMSLSTFSTARTSFSIR